MAVKVYGKNTPATTLTEKEFLASGGEGDIYVRNGVVFKIYQDPKKTIPQKKIDELSVLTLPNIIKPDDLLLSEKGLPIGYAMKFIQNTIPLPKLFTTSFLTRNNIPPSTSEKLVEKMMEGIDHIHNHGILIVDCNEFNFLVNASTFEDPLFIDCDSYQTPSFPASALMESVKDWTATRWTTGSDWFSFGILAFQIFVGIHPFRGVHPTVTGLENRVRKGLSVLNKDVGLPPTRDFSLIPPNMMAWFEETFEQGRREPPPMVMGKAIFKAHVTMVQGSDKLIISEVGDFGAPILGVVWINGFRIAFHKGAAFLDKKPISLSSTRQGVIEYNGKYFLIDTVNELLTVEDAYSKVSPIQSKIAAKRVLIHENRVYVLSGDKFNEIVFNDLGGKTFVTVKASWGILPSSYTVYRGCVLSDVLGLPHAYLPFKAGSCAILALPELKDYKILDAKYEDRVLIVVGATKNGQYDELTFRFNETHVTKQVSVSQDITPAGVNFVTLPNGMFISLTGDDNLELGTVADTQKRVLTKVGMDKNAILCHDGMSVYFFSDTKLYSVKMK